MSRLLRVSLAALATAVIITPGAGVTGCASAEKARTPTDVLKSLNGEWVLSELNGVEVTRLLPAGSEPPNLRIEPDGKVSGFTGVNRLASRVDMEALGRGEFRLAQAITTMMAGPPEAMEVETAYLKALAESGLVKVDGSTFSSSKGERSLLKFVRGG